MTPDLTDVLTLTRRLAQDPDMRLMLGWTWGDLFSVLTNAQLLAELAEIRKQETY